MNDTERACNSSQSGPEDGDRELPGDQHDSKPDSREASDRKGRGEGRPPGREAGDAVQPREIGGRKGPDPVRYGDWEKNGRCIDF